MPGWTLPLPQRPLTPVQRADCLDGSGGALAGSGMAAPAPTLARMFVLADGLCATGFPIGFTVAVIRDQTGRIAFLGRGRAERAITEQQLFGRQAIASSRPGRRGR
jgi:hypothetical protein